MTLSPRRLTEIVLELVGRPGHEKIRALMYELLVYGLGASSTDIHFERPLPEVHGRLDALLGQTVFEFKRDLRRERRIAEEELGRYLPQRECETGERFIGIATDGALFQPYETDGGGLVALPSYQPSVDDPGALLVWLDAAVSLQPDLVPNPAVVRVEIGRESLAYRRAMARLRSLWGTVGNSTDVRAKRNLWAEFLSLAYGGDVDEDDLFLHHTYLTIVAKTIATRVLGVPLPDPADLMSGHPFRQAGIAGVVESDFFDWVLSGPDGEGLVSRVSRQVARFRLDGVEHCVLKDLYESLIDPAERHYLVEYYTPDWLAARICERGIDSPLSQRVLDPACGSGTFLYHAVRRCIEAAEEARMGPSEILTHCIDSVIGIDVHPVAVLFARVAYLLALGEERLRSREHAIALPVYLGDSLQWNTRAMFAHLDIVIRVPDGPDLYFPEALAEDPARFDETVRVMMDLGEQDVSEEAFGAWLSREAIVDDADADILVSTFGHLRQLFRSGLGGIWGYVARNLSRPLWLSSGGRRVHVIIGNPPWLPYRSMSATVKETFQRECRKRKIWQGSRLATHQDMSAYYFARCAELYLERGGMVAFVMPYGALNRAQFSRLRSGRFASAEVRFVDAWAFDETVQPLFPIPACVLFAERTRAGMLPAEITVYSGQLPRRDATEAEACRSLKRRIARWPGSSPATERSPYAKSFRQGATMVPRRLCLAIPVETGRLGGNRAMPLVESCPGRLEKQPWHQLQPLRHPVEAEFLRPLYLGESVAPFRVLGSALAVVPWDAERGELLDAALATQRGLPGLALWLEAAERLWRENTRGKLSLLKRWNYLEALEKQFPPAPIRVVYAKSGQSLAAAIIEDRRAVIDHKLYWASFHGYAEALYVTGLLNSEEVRMRIADLQSKGRWGARDVDKLVFELSIPRFDARNPVHQAIMRAALEAERIAGAVVLAAGINFVQARRAVRAALKGAGIAQTIDALVNTLLAATASEAAGRSLQHTPVAPYLPETP